MTAKRLLLCLPFLAATGLPSAPAWAQAPGSQTAEAGSAPREYTAGYTVEYKGRRAASAEFAVSADDDDSSLYRFRSSTEARGIYRLASPRPVVESSRFALERGEIRPLGFSYEDGSRKGEDNYAIEFDRGERRVRVTTADAPLELPLENGLLDRGSLQVALMRDLDRCRQPGPYRFVDEDGVRSYSYVRLDDMPTDTALGHFDTVRFAQQREGSSRSTVLWLARDFGYLPVRIEQFRDGEAETVLTLESLEGIERQSSSCRNFG